MRLAVVATCSRSLLALLVGGSTLGCGSRGATTWSDNPGVVSPATNVGHGGSKPTADPGVQFGSDTWATAGDAAVPKPPDEPSQDGPPFGLSTRCGDAIVGPAEECDDGPGTELDACTQLCQTRDQLADPEKGAPKVLSHGRHPSSGLERGFMTSFVPASGDVEVRGTLFDIWGHAQQSLTVSEGAAPSGRGDPVVAALPDGAYAVAWTDVFGDGVDLGIALRRVEPTGELQPLTSANDALPFPQTSPDLVWTGQELIAAWVDYGDVSTGPDIHYKRFDANLFPLTEELILADSAAAETDVALARFGDKWAAAFRQSGENRTESIVVQVGESAYTMGPFHGAGLGDHPALVQLDEQHLLAVFTAGPDDWDELDAKSVLRYAVIDTASAESPTSYVLEALSPWLQAHPVSALRPAAEMADHGAYLAWSTTAPNGDATGDQVWLKRVTWNAESGLGLDIAEEPAQRTCDESAGNQMNPALARTELPPGGALVVNWNDEARSLGGESAPDVVVHYAPTRTPDESWSNGLMRAPAAFRVCRPDAPCAGNEGCCSDSLDCAGGYACVASGGTDHGLGSFANTCAPSN